MKEKETEKISMLDKEIKGLNIYVENTNTKQAEIFQVLDKTLCTYQIGNEIEKLGFKWIDSQIK